MEYSCLAWNYQILCLMMSSHSQQDTEFIGIATVDPAVQSLLDLHRGFMLSRLESMRQEMLAGRLQGSNDAQDGEYEYFLDTDRMLCSMKKVIGSSNRRRSYHRKNLMVEPVFTDTQTTFVVTNPEGNPKVTSFLLVMVTKNVKELINKDKLTIADLEGASLEMLKSRYKNYMELEYHIEQMKSAMSDEAKWGDGEDDLTKPQYLEKKMSKSAKPDIHILN
ncbi:hypothetical protein Tco_1200967 [Tanacetum coccineum]